MTDLTNYRVTDGIDDVLAVQYNRVIDATVRGELSNIETLAANKTLIDADYALQVLTPTAARDVILPAVAATNHPYYIVNASATYALTIKNAGGSTIGTVGASSSGSYASDGIAWHNFGGGAAKAAYTDVATGTDDIKYVTSLAIKNSVNVPNVAPGSANNVLVSTGSAWSSGAAIREKLTTTRNYYVRTDGSNSNTGLANTSGGAFLTIQHAVDVAASLDSVIYDIYIYVADGTYTVTDAIGVTLKQVVGAGSVYIIGNETTPGNVIVAAAGAATIAFSAANHKTTYAIRGMQITGVNSNNWALQASQGAAITFQNIEFGAGLVKHIRVADAGFISATGNYKIFAGSAGLVHITANGAYVRVAGFTITLVGTPAFTAFVSALRGAIVYIGTCTFVGTATGQRYAISLNAIVQAAAGETYLPGDLIGSATLGAIYENGSTLFPVTCRVASNFTVNSTTLVDVTGLACSLQPGRSYRFVASLYTTSNVASGVKFALAAAGGASVAVYEAMVLQAGVLVAPGTSRATAIGTTVGNVTAVTAATCIIRGTLTATAAGNLTLQFADNAGTNVSTMLAGSTFEIQDVT